MIDIRVATEQDILDVVMRSREVYDSEEDLLERTRAGLAKGPTFALVAPDGKVGCIVGSYIIWAGVARVWAVTTNDMDQYPVGYTKSVLALIRWGVKYYNIHRLEMLVKSTYFSGVRWAKIFGFEAEGLLRSYGSDQSDYLIFGRLS